MSAKHLKTVILMLIAMSATTIGDIFLAKAMKQVGSLQVYDLTSAWNAATEVLSHGQFWIAIGFFTVFFCLWITVLSYEELSYALPLTALTYIFNAVLAGPMLGEVLSPMRWLGTILIGLGVGIVSASSDTDINVDQDDPGETTTNDASPISQPT